MSTAVATREAALRALHARLRTAWTRESSSDPAQWSPENPAWGQCAVTALIVQDQFAGDLLRADVQGISHYWNRLPGGTEVDLTWEQFGPSAVKLDVAERDRGYVVSFPETVERYERIRERMASRS